MNHEWPGGVTCNNKVSFTVQFHLSAVFIKGVRKLNVAAGIEMNLGTVRQNKPDFLARSRNSLMRGYLVTFARHFSLKYVIDRKSTRLNSSHVASSYAVFCLNK